VEAQGDHRPRGLTRGRRGAAPSVNAFYHPLFSSYLRTSYSEDAVQPVQQAFNYGVYSAEDPVLYPPDSRFPTREELRFWAWSDLTLGVTGLWWWSWERANEHADGPAWLSDTFWPVFEEVATFVAAAHPASAPVAGNPGPYDLVDYTYLATWPRPGGTLVVATNGSNEERSLEIDLGAAHALGTLVGWDGETADATLDETGGLTVVAAPYAVFVWTLPPPEVAP
jgi:hypothetical protein